MKVAILGFEREGRASFDYFSAAGHDITICDKDPKKEVPADAASRLGEYYLDNLDEFDLVVRTAVINPERILEKNPGIIDKITTGNNEFIAHCPTRNIIGVTGTKGKGTTSTLITKMLEAAGHTVHLGGNIGVPALSLMPNISDGDWVVLELSSFQLSDLRQSPHIAVCLMIAPEHQDWHGSLEAYYTAKEQLFAHQTPGDLAIYYDANPLSKRIASAGMGQKIPYYKEPGAEVVDGAIVINGHQICRTEDIKLLGEHNWQNACAAVTAVWYGLGLDRQSAAGVESVIMAMHHTLSNFGGLPFRIEYRTTKHDIRYYNDSFASSQPAPLAAIDAIPGHKVVIIGGFDRQLAVEELVSGLVKRAGSLRHLLLIGATSHRVAEACRKQNFTDYLVSRSTTMADIVREATELAQPGDAVLLSPGFPSFDMFKDFEDRGHQFNDAVDKI